MFTNTHTHITDVYTDLLWNFKHNEYSSTSTSWRRRGLKRVPRSDLDQLIQRALLST